MNACEQVIGWLIVVVPVPKTSPESESDNVSVTVVVDSGVSVAVMLHTSLLQVTEPVTAPADELRTNPCAPSETVIAPLLVPVRPHVPTPYIPVYDQLPTGSTSAEVQLNVSTNNGTTILFNTSSSSMKLRVL